MSRTATLPAETPDHAGVAFCPPFLLAGSLLLGFLIRRIVPFTASTSKPRLRRINFA